MPISPMTLSKPENPILGTHLIRQYNPHIIGTRLIEFFFLFTTLQPTTKDISADGVVVQ